MRIFGQHISRIDLKPRPVEASIFQKLCLPGMQRGPNLWRHLWTVCLGPPAAAATPTQRLFIFLGLGQPSTRSIVVDFLRYNNWYD